MPNAVATSICVKFQVPPGPLVAQVLRALATRNIVQLASGTASENYDFANPNFYVQLIEDEADKLIKNQARFGGKQDKNPQNWTGNDKLKLWSHSQRKHLFVG